MVEANVQIITELKEFLETVVNQSDIRQLFTTDEADFSRKRKLPLEKLVGILINLPKRSLSIEIQEFFDSLGQGKQSCTKSAFCLQRIKLNPLFFAVWNKWLVDNFYHYYGDTVKRWKGFRLLAVDGSSAYLLNKQELREHFGTQDNQHVQIPMGRIMQIQDVLNDITVWGDIYPLKDSEQQIICQQVEQLFEDSVTLFDRGFPSFVLMYLLMNQEMPRHFVMRCRSNFNNHVKDFLRSGKSSKIIEFRPDERAIAELRKHGYIITADTTIKVRMIKIKLPGAVLEVLLTDLYDEKVYGIQDLKALYAMRWQIETTYGKQKNQQQMEVFSGHKVICIEQDYTAGLFVANLQSLIEKQCERYVQQVSENRKLDYKINRNVSWAALKHKIVQLFLYEDPVTILLHLQKAFERNLEPLRPNRHYQRIRKAKRLNAKYQTFTNYKRAI
jgi:hypothetical protein